MLLWNAIVELGIVVYVLVPLACGAIGLAVFAGFAIAEKCKRKTVDTPPRNVV